MAAQGELVRLLLEHRDGLFGFILALTHDREAAEEIFQEVGIAVVQESHQGERVERFLPWAHELARRRVAEYYRKSSRRRAMERLESLDDVVAEAFEENPLEPGTERRRQDYLETCIEELSPGQREMIERRYKDRGSIREIAGSLERTEGSVKVGLWKARQQLSRCIEEKMGE